MSTQSRVKEILSWYRSENYGVQKNLFQMLSTGALAGTGKMVILPVDQGFEHGPARTFGPNPAGYDARYHFELAIESGCSAYAAPYGQVAAGADDFIGQIPVIVKVNNSDSLYSNPNPIPAITCPISEAVRLGASGIGFTIYPGSALRKEMLEEVCEIGKEARSYGLPLVLWSYPRGEQISKEGETSIDVVSYAAHIAAQIGAHIIKVKPPTERIELEEAKKVYIRKEIPIATLAERTKHVIESAFGGRRIVIFSGGAAKKESEVLEEIRGLNAGGAFGSIIGRNSFQREKPEAIQLLQNIMKIYSGR
ncbi:MAG: class I fructose-bisphosphate aldolase [Bdellovibrionales bacterium]|nr:class I fructose-bisphosphate aldolase [Bdellovibrionales bacterium]